MRASEWLPVQQVRGQTADTPINGYRNKKVLVLHSIKPSLSSMTEVLNLPGCHDVNLEENDREKERAEGEDKGIEGGPYIRLLKFV